LDVNFEVLTVPFTADRLPGAVVLRRLAR